MNIFLTKKEYLDQLSSHNLPGEKMRKVNEIRKMAVKKTISFVASKKKKSLRTYLLSPNDDDDDDYNLRVKLNCELFEC